MDTNKQCLRSILPASGHPDLLRALFLLPYLTKHETLRQAIVIACEAISTLIRMLLDRPTKGLDDNTLSLVVDSIYHLVQTKEGVYVVCPV